MRGLEADGWPQQTVRWISMTVRRAGASRYGVRVALDSIGHDVRGAVRSAFRRPGFSLLVTVILGLGIGASATILTIVYALLVRPLPFKDADRLVILRTRVGRDLGKVALREYRTLEQNARLFDGLAAYYPSQYNLTTSGGA